MTCEATALIAAGFDEDMPKRLASMMRRMSSRTLYRRRSHGTLLRSDAA